MQAARKLADQEKHDNVAPEKSALTADQKAMVEANITGSRKTLKADAALPVGMAVIYLLLIFFFKAQGGYKPVKIDDQAA